MKKEYKREMIDKKEGSGREKVSYGVFYVGSRFFISNVVVFATKATSFSFS